MYSNDSDKVNWAQMLVAVAAVIWIMSVIGVIWESCTLF